MADFLLSPIFDLLFANLTSSAIEEIKLLWNVEDEVDSLSNTLSTIRAVLEDAEEQQITSRAVKDWLRKLKDVAYDADDVLDDFATQAAQAQAKIEPVPLESSSRSKKVKRSFISYFFRNKLVNKHEMGSKMNEIRERLDKIESDRRFHLNISSQGRTVGKKDRPKTSSFVDESAVFGRDDDKKKILQILMSDESNNGNNFSVLPIIGMGGQGKTTLAQLVYNDKQLQNLFEVRAWVCVSDNFDVLRITHEIIQSVTKSHFESLSIEPTQRRLFELLSGKRFLIILDDVWNEDPFDWEILRGPFSGGASGSKIIVTTRIEKVAQIMGTNIPPHHLKRLSQDDSWSLFVKKVFRGDNLDIVQGALIDIGKKIVGKCGGLPLAIKSLGGLLSTTRNLNAWKNVLESKIWELRESDKGILPALRLSYHHLSSNLKQCFSYCSIFPKDYRFQKEELVKLWMGEGYIQSKAGMEMEEVGEELFDDLLARSFFSLLSYDYTKYVMHDLIHDLAEFVSKDDCLRIEAGEPVEAPMVIARHLGFIQGGKKIDKQIKLDDLCGYKSLLRIRTFIYKNQGVRLDLVQLGDSFENFSSLRVLSLRYGEIKEIPSSIGNLKHLRYLDLSKNPFKRLPDSVSRLYNLQTLILNECPYLIELPKGTMDMINLRHLQFVDCHRLTCSPPRMRKLTQLRDLSKFIVGGDGSECTIVELKDLVNLGGRIEIRRLGNVANREEAEKADLKNKKYLEKLTLSWIGYGRRCNNSGQDEEVLEGLQPHINLKELTIDCYRGASLPSWLLQQNQFLTFTNLQSITFSLCKKCQLLPPLWKLPSLKYLKLQAMHGLERLESQFCGVQGFPLLETLELRDLVNLEEWWGEEGGGDYMPSLRTLEVWRCPKLKRFPLHLSPALSKLRINDCKELVAELRFPSLEELTLGEVNVSLLKSVPYLTSLQRFSYQNDDEMEFLDIMQNLHSLRNLEIWHCSKLSRFYPPANLKSLFIDDCPNLDLEALPLDLHDLSSLHSLVLIDCPKVASLPEKGLPASLRMLTLVDCPKVASLPKKWLPTSLIHLHVAGCPLLIERCEKEKGEDWHKISHIRGLYILKEGEALMIDKGMLSIELEKGRKSDGKRRVISFG